LFSTTTSTVIFLFHIYVFSMFSQQHYASNNSTLRVCEVLEWAAIQQSNFSKQLSTDKRHHRQLINFNCNIKLEPFLLHDEHVSTFDTSGRCTQRPLADHDGHRQSVTCNKHLFYTLTWSEKAKQTRQFSQLNCNNDSIDDKWSWPVIYLHSGYFSIQSKWHLVSGRPNRQHYASCCRIRNF